jgi:hypothetical protein
MRMHTGRLSPPLRRRTFLSTLTLTGASVLIGSGRLRQVLAQEKAPALITADKMRPAIPCRDPTVCTMG